MRTDLLPHLVSNALKAQAGVCTQAIRVHIYVLYCLFTRFTQVSCYFVAAHCGYWHDSYPNFTDAKWFPSHHFHGVAIAPAHRVLSGLFSILQPLFDFFGRQVFLHFVDCLCSCAVIVSLIGPRGFFVLCHGLYCLFR